MYYSYYNKTYIIMYIQYTLHYTNTIRLYLTDETCFIYTTTYVKKYTGKKDKN